MLKGLLDMHPQRPELRREIRKLPIGQLLSPEHQDGAIDKRRLDGDDLTRREWFRDINPGDLRPDITAR